MKVVTAEYLTELCSMGFITRDEMMKMFEFGHKDHDVVPLSVCIEIRPHIPYSYEELD